MNNKRIVFFIVLCLFTIFSWATPSRAADHVLLIGGLGGNAGFSEEFLDTLDSLRTLLVDKHGYEKSRVRFLGAPTTATERVDAISTLENIQKEFDRLTSESQQGDTFLFIAVGHGQSDFQEPKFNLPGEDLTAKALDHLLDTLPARDQRLVLSFSCSGHFSRILSRPARAILASTDGPRQVYRAHMTRFLPEALEAKETDADENGEISLLELFMFLSAKVSSYFEERGILQTETPSIDDNGDGEVSALYKGEIDGKDGSNASFLRLAPAPGKKKQP